MKRQSDIQRAVMESAKGKMQDELNVRKERRKSARLSGKFKPETKPTLTFTSRYKGVSTQILRAEQEIGFVQVARLDWNAGAPGDIASYFDLHQWVYDEIKYAGRDSEVRDWELDGPYQPPYEGAQTSADKTSITFTDEPGFSSTGSRADNRKVKSGDWLERYAVSFCWRVTRLDTREVWQSPVVTHTVTSTPNSEWSNAPVIAAAAGNSQWEVDLLPNLG